MTSLFPSGLDNFQNPTPADNLNTPQVLHSDQHSNENDAIEAIEAWVGISGTTAQASHEFRIKSLEGKPFPQELIGIMGWDEGTPIGTGTVLNVVGSGGTLSLSGTVLNLDISSQGGGGVPGLGFVGWNKGELVGTGTILNVTENDLTLSRSGTVFDIFRTTGTAFYLGINGSRVYAYRASGTWLIISNSPDPQELIGTYGLSNGVPLGTGTWIDFGNNLTATLSGTVLRVNGVSPVFPQELIGVYGRDEGQNVGTGTILNIVGENVSLSLSGTTLTLLHTNPTITFPQEVIGIMGQDEGIPLGTGSTLNIVGNNIALSISGNVLQLTHTDTPVTFPQEVIGFYAENKGIPLGTGSILNVNGSRLVATISGTTVELSNSPDPVELIGIFGQDEGLNLGTGTVFNVTGENIALSLSGTVLNLSHTNPSIIFPQEVIGIFGKDEGQSVGTGTILNVIGENISLSLSGTTLTLEHTNPAINFPQELIGVMGQNQGIPLGTGTTLNVNGSRLVATLSGTVLQISNSPDPAEIIGIYGVNQGSSLGTGTVLSVTGSRLSMSLVGNTINLTSSPDPQELIGVMGWDDGIPKGTGTVIDFGNNLSVSLSGTVLRVDATAGGSTFAGVDQIGIFGQDEGVPVGTGTIFNVTGGRAVLSRSGTVLNLDISPEPQDNIGVVFQNEGNFLATGVTIDVMGAVTLSGTVVNLRVPKTISLVTPGIVAGGLVFTNLVANDSTYLGVVTDLTGYTQCRLGGVFGAASLAVASGTIIHIMWATGSSYATLTELALNKDGEEGRLRWIASTQRATDWFPINAGAAYKEVGLHLRITGGNSTADPNLLGLFAEFR